VEAHLVPGVLLGGNMSGFKSKAQKVRLKKLVDEGKLKPEIYDGLDKDTEGTLPHRMRWPKIPQGQKVKVLRAIKVPKR
jgi:hypothetical protein